jgi:hypothetical protein
MASDMNLAPMAPTMESEAAMNKSERRIAMAVHSSSGKRIKIALGHWSIKNHLVVVGSRLWYLGNALPDAFSIHLAQRDSHDGLPFVIQCLGHPQGLYRLLSRGILRQDPMYSGGDIFMLSDSIERQLEAEGKRSAESSFLFT